MIVKHYPMIIRITPNHFQPTPGPPRAKRKTPSNVSALRRRRARLDAACGVQNPLVRWHSSLQDGAVTVEALDNYCGTREKAKEYVKKVLTEEVARGHRHG